MTSAAKRSDDLRAMFAVVWSAFVVALLAPENLWLPYLQSNPRTLLVKSLRGSVYLLMLFVLRVFIARWADRAVVRGTRHNATLAAGAALFVAAWLAANALDGGTAGLTLAALAVHLGVVLAAVSLDGITVATGRRIRSTGVLAALVTLSYVGTGLVSDLLADVGGDSRAAAAGVPIVFALSLIALAWPGRARTVLASPPRPLVPPTNRPRAFWTAALVAAFAHLEAFNPLIARHFSELGEGIDHAYATSSRWGYAAGAILFLALNRRWSLRLLLPFSLILGACAMISLPVVHSELTVALAGAAHGGGEAMVAVALLCLLMRAAPAGREAFAFALMRLVSVALGSVVLPLHMWLNEGSLARLPLLAVILCGLALVALWFVPRDLLDEEGG